MKGSEILCSYIKSINFVLNQFCNYYDIKNVNDFFDKPNNKKKDDIYLINMKISYNFHGVNYDFRLDDNTIININMDMFNKGKINISMFNFLDYLKSTLFPLIERDECVKMLLDLEHENYLVNSIDITNLPSELVQMPVKILQIPTYGGYNLSNKTIDLCIEKEIYTPSLWQLS